MVRVTRILYACVPYEPMAPNGPMQGLGPHTPGALMGRPHCAIMRVLRGPILGHHAPGALMSRP